MNAAITMVKTGNYIPFRVYEDGSATWDNNGTVIRYPDFAATFIQMCDRGWRQVSELVFEAKPRHTQDATASKANANRPKGGLRQYDGYRQDWYDYMGEWESNNEEFDFCLA